MSLKYHTVNILMKYVSDVFINFHKKSFVRTINYQDDNNNLQLSESIFPLIQN